MTRIKVGNLEKKAPQASGDPDAFKIEKKRYNSVRDFISSLDVRECLFFVTLIDAFYDFMMGIVLCVLVSQRKWLVGVGTACYPGLPTIGLLIVNLFVVLTVTGNRVWILRVNQIIGGLKLIASFLLLNIWMTTTSQFVIDNINSSNLEQVLMAVWSFFPVTICLSFHFCWSIVRFGLLCSTVILVIEENKESRHDDRLLETV
ncbi:unnamed protein product [Caenorhabditis sp. 36 PRJEB53466]|nr:unnamed protein product [Caenorhabditis sp. 36 PRJEB53466]